MPSDTAPPSGTPLAARRCFGDGNPLYEEYHDTEWGRPVHGDRALFERVALESFQSGLAWITVLRKRPAFREAFADFDAGVVARYGEADVARLLADAGIIRNRAKIEATIANARAVLALAESGRSLDEVFWSHAPDRSAHVRPQAWEDVPPVTAESRALARELKSLGFRFIGPTTAYAAMQACGLVDDHLAGCPVVVASRAPGPTAPTR
ncbi:DNA-3-methyladenine glycosylase I [Cellulomonas chengniuliangii]|uniref:DNA-3-methyladenine glycosylase I n=1 Tax=Cellulomonas chengniuliangii TaxID=2968084 RepID=A0ABY5L019_9CELL|nr:DNA-3-methyladenine glycosylase I [Cellulomonas chengniuliangii]MCC2307825.1 DNA-3-methyladenine glycosylase I [Cellulomonas chengniuliangii]UUI75418.1 DNA-3-methyladenine glycosylase I [Cellulomonas chengniuliangii]